MYTRSVKASILVLSILVIAGVSVSAQNTRLRVDVPFEFKVGDSTMPAGKYDVGMFDKRGAAFKIRAVTGSADSVRFTRQLERGGDSAKSVLVFNRYRENGGEVTYFLSQVWVKGEKVGYEFYKDRVEREAAKRSDKRDLITLVVRPADRSAE